MTENIRGDVETAQEALGRVAAAINGTDSSPGQPNTVHGQVRMVTTYNVRLAANGMLDPRYRGLLIRTTLGTRTYWEWQLLSGSEVAPKITCKYDVAHDAKKALLYAWGHRLTIECLGYPHEVIETTTDGAQA